MSFLVTGAAGFLGQALVGDLLARGEPVRAFDLHRIDADESALEWMIGDVRDAEAVHRACAGVDVVYHLAALIPQRKADAATMRAVNVGGTRNVLEGALAQGVQRVVYLSSAEVYGIPDQVPCAENAPLNPLGEYGRNKVAAEALCRQAVERGLETTCLRPPTIVGPGLAEPFLVGLIEAIRRGRPVTLLGRGENRFHLVHIEDVVSAYLLAAEHPAAVGEAFNLASKDVPAVREMVETVIARAGSASRVQPVPVWAARLAVLLLHPLGKSPLEPEHLPIAVADYLFDTRKAQQVLGWSPRWSNVDAIWAAYADAGDARQAT